MQQPNERPGGVPRPELPQASETLALKPIRLTVFADHVGMAPPIIPQIAEENLYDFSLGAIGLWNTHGNRAAITEMNDVLNLRGLKCPLPVLRTRKALRHMSPEGILVVECTDALAAIDIPNLLRETGDILEEQIRSEDAVIFRIRKM